MKTAACWLGWVLAAVGSAQAQNFVNLSFDDVRFTPSPADETVMTQLTWDQAMPGWSHGEGDSTDVVNYWRGHVGFSQSYVLFPYPPSQFHDPILWEESHETPHAFAFAMRGGTFHEQEPRGVFVPAFIEQRGLIPVGRTTLRLFAVGARFFVGIDGEWFGPSPDGLDPTSPTYAQDRRSYLGDWSLDISRFSGRVVTLRIANADEPFVDLVVDDIRFLPVPEPSAAVLTLAGILLGGGIARRRRCAAVTQARSRGRA